MLLSNENMSIFSLLTQRQKNEQVTKNNPIKPINDQTPTSLTRPRSGFTQFDTQSVHSDPGQLAGLNNLSSKSFWSMDMLRLREKEGCDTTTVNTHTITLPPVTMGPTNPVIVPSRKPPSGYYRKRSGSEELVRPKLLERRRTLMDTFSMSKTASLQQIQNPIVGGACGKSTANKPSLTGLYGVPQTNKRRNSLQLPPLKKSSSEEIYSCQ